MGKQQAAALDPRQADRPIKDVGRNLVSPFSRGEHDRLPIEALGIKE
jgi:hypothetical protein